MLAMASYGHKNVAKMMAQHDLTLFDLQNVEPLVEDIRRNAPRSGGL